MKLFKAGSEAWRTVATVAETFALVPTAVEALVARKGANVFLAYATDLIALVLPT